jgi:integrase
MDINEACESVLSFLVDIPMSASTIRYYGSCYRTVRRFCEQRGIKVFTDQAAQSFVEFQMERYEKGEIKIVYAKTLRKAAMMLADCSEGRELKWGRRNYKLKRLCDNYESVLLEFEASIERSLSPGSTKLVLQMARQFLDYLERGGVRSLCKLKPENVKDFVILASPRHKGNMLNLTWPIKKFIAFLDSCGIVTINGAAILANPVPQRKKVLPCFATEEAEAILAAPDTDTPLGKRDYAIMRLALGMGLRGEDIVSLRLPDIDWRSNEISIVQSKTGGHVLLPLMPDVGNAVADYILNARPQTDSPYVFVRHRKPHGWLGNGPIGATIMKRYQEKSGIPHEPGDGKTFHAFRRTVGTRLIKAGVPLPAAAQILGHRRIESSKQYIALDDEALRVCCMDISAFATKKEGLA